MLRTRGTLIGTMALIALLAAVTPTLVVANSVGVTATFRIAPTVSAELVDGGLTVHSTSPWQMVAEVAGDDGKSTLVYASGDRTDGSGVYVPADGLVGYSLVLDTTR